MGEKEPFRTLASERRKVNNYLSQITGFCLPRKAEKSYNMLALCCILGAFMKHKIVVIKKNLRYYST